MAGNASSDAGVPSVVGYPIPAVAASPPGGVPDVAVVAVVDVRKFRVGPDTYSYDYTLVPGISHGGRPTYRCARGRDNEPGTLWMYFDVALEVWTAVIVVGHVDTATDIVNGGALALRAAVAGDDVRQPGMHQWACYDSRRSTWWPASAFRTTSLS